MSVAFLLAIAIAGASPSPAPAATPALKTIVSVKSSSRCAEIITHANGAIGATLSNDSEINHTISWLRLVDFDDGNAIHRRNSMNALGDMAKTLMQQARSGDDEVKRLRKIASQTKDPKAAKDLKDFADELGGALWRQQKIARDLNGFLAYEDFKEMATPTDGEKVANRSIFGVDDPQAEMPLEFQPRDAQGQHYNVMHPMIGHDPNDATATQYARAAADDLKARIPDILQDELNAAGKVDGALGSC